MNEGQLQPKSRIFSILAGLCQGKRTGTLFLSTERNHLASISLQDGNIVALQYRIRKGSQAIPFLNQIESASYKFDQGHKISPQSDLASTQNILKQLGVNLNQAEAPAPNLTYKRDLEGTIPKSQRDTIEQTLAQYIGPFAAITCQKVFSETGDLSQALDLLKEQIIDTAMANQFMNDVLTNLRNLGPR